MRTKGRLITNCFALNGPQQTVECCSLFAGAEIHPVSAVHATAGPGKDL